MEIIIIEKMNFWDQNQHNRTLLSMYFLDFSEVLPDDRY